MTNGDYKLIRLNENQYDIADRTNYHEWGAPVLTIEQYLDREHTLRKLPFKPVGWALVKSNEDANNTSQILATCETFQRPCVIRYDDGRVELGDCVAIASVFTQPQHRKNGYATELMKLLQQELRTWDNVIASTLYSDIGPEFYSRLGWKAFPSISCEIPVEAWKQTQQDTFMIAEAALDVLMNTDDVRDLIDADIKSIMSSVEHANSPAFSLLPSYDALVWHLSRSIIYAKHLGLPTPKRCGVRFRNSFFLWAPNWSDKCLYVVRHSLASPTTDTLALVNAAVEEAKAMCLPKVCIWDPHPELEGIGKSQGLEFIVERTSSLSSAVFFKSTGSSDISLIQWQNNEKFFWV